MKYGISEWCHPAFKNSEIAFEHSYSSCWNPQPTGRQAKEGGRTFTEFEFLKPRIFRKPKKYICWVNDNCWKIIPEFVILTPNG